MFIAVRLLRVSVARRNRTRRQVSLSLVFLLCFSMTSHTPLFGEIPRHSIPLNITSMSSKEDIRFEFTGKQLYDSSCGLSVAATILDQYWDIATTESELVSELIGTIPGHDGLLVSLGDIAELLAARGITSRGFRMTVEEIAIAIDAGYAPLIAHYDTPTRHFVLVFGVDNHTERVIVGDPATGLHSVSIGTFLGRYSGVVLLTASAERGMHIARLSSATNRADSIADTARRVVYSRNRRF